MAMVVCAVGGGKGGVGRTTSAINIGAALEQFDYDTVVVDADLGMSDLGLTLGLDVETGIHSVLAGQASLRDALVELPGGLAVLPGERDLESYAAAETSALRDVADALREQYDVVLVDTSAGLSSETSIALGVADSAILVVTPDESAVSNARKTKQLTERLDVDVAGVLLTHVRDSEELDRVDQQLDMPVLGGIPVDEAIGEEPVMIKALDSTAAAAYGECADRFDSLVVRETAAEVDPAFDDGWVTHLESPDALKATDASRNGTADEATTEESAGDGPEDDSEDETDDADNEEETDEFTGGALPFG
jgi:septum site-determining protein MinD